MRRPFLILSPTDRIQRNLDDGSAIASGTYGITRTLVLANQDDAIVRTTGRRVTLGWQGPPEGPFFRVDDCTNPSFRELDLLVQGRLRQLMLVRRTHGSNPRPSTGLHLKDVRVFGQSLLTHGVRFEATDTDANNEHAHFERVDFYDWLGGNAVHITHKQSKEHYFEKCHFGTNGTPTTVGIESVSGFAWDKGTMYGCLPFLLSGGGGDRVTVRDSAFENCPRVLVQPHATTDHWAVLLDGVTYRANAIAADGEWVQLYNAGPLTVSNCQIGGGQMPLVPVIGVHAPDSIAPTLTIFGNAFDAFGADLVCPVRGKVVVHWGLNTYTRDANLDPRTKTIGEWYPKTA